MQGAGLLMAQVLDVSGYSLPGVGSGPMGHDYLHHHSMT